MVEIVLLERGWVTLNAIFRGKGASPTNEFWHQKTRVPVLSYGEKIAENFNRLSRAHQRHRQTTDRRQTDESAIAHSEREREFTSAKNPPLQYLQSRCLISGRKLTFPCDRPVSQKSCRKHQHQLTRDRQRSTTLSYKLLWIYIALQRVQLFERVQQTT